MRLISVLLLILTLPTLVFAQNRPLVAILDTPVFYEYGGFRGAIDLELLKRTKIRFNGMAIPLYDLNELIRKNSLAEYHLFPGSANEQLWSGIEHGSKVAKVIIDHGGMPINFIGPADALHMAYSMHKNIDQAEEMLRQYFAGITQVLETLNIQVVSLSWISNSKNFASYIQLVEPGLSASQSLEHGHKIQKIIQNFFRQNSKRFFVLAAGNEALPLNCDSRGRCARVGLPIRKNILAVGALDRNGIADYSNWGERVDLYARVDGERLPVIVDEGIANPVSFRWTRDDTGTSFAAPQVAGELAVFMRQNPTSQNVIEDFYRARTWTQSRTLRPDPISIIQNILNRPDSKKCEELLEAIGERASLTIRTLVTHDLGGD